MTRRNGKDILRDSQNFLRLELERNTGRELIYKGFLECVGTTDKGKGKGKGGKKSLTPLTDKDIRVVCDEIRGILNGVLKENNAHILKKGKKSNPSEGGEGGPVLIIFIKKLVLSNHHIGDQGCIDLFQLLIDYRINVDDFRLFNNRIGDAGCVKIGEYLKKNTYKATSEMHLSDNFIQIHGWWTILEAIASNIIYPRKDNPNNNPNYNSFDPIINASNKDKTLKKDEFYVTPLWLRVNQNKIEEPIKHLDIFNQKLREYRTKEIIRAEHSLKNSSELIKVTVTNQLFKSFAQKQDDQTSYKGYIVQNKTKHEFPICHMLFTQKQKPSNSYTPENAQLPIPIEIQRKWKDTVPSIWSKNIVISREEVNKRNASKVRQYGKEEDTTKELDGKSRFDGGHKDSKEGEKVTPRTRDASLDRRDDRRDDRKDDRKDRRDDKRDDRKDDYRRDMDRKDDYRRDRVRDHDQKDRKDDYRRDRKDDQRDRDRDRDRKDDRDRDRERRQDGDRDRKERNPERDRKGDYGNDYRNYRDDYRNDRDDYRKDRDRSILDREAAKKTTDRDRNNLDREAAKKTTDRDRNILDREAAKKTTDRDRNILDREAAKKTTDRDRNILDREAAKKPTDRDRNILDREAAKKTTDRDRNILDREAANKKRQLNLEEIEQQNAKLRKALETKSKSTIERPNQNRRQVQTSKPVVSPTLSNNILDQPTLSNILDQPLSNISFDRTSNTLHLRETERINRKLELAIENKNKKIDQWEKELEQLEAAKEAKKRKQEAEANKKTAASTTTSTLGEPNSKKRKLNEINAALSAEKKAEKCTDIIVDDINNEISDMFREDSQAKESKKSSSNLLETSADDNVHEEVNINNDVGLSPLNLGSVEFETIGDNAFGDYVQDIVGNLDDSFEDARSIDDVRSDGGCFLDPRSQPGRYESTPSGNANDPFKTPMGGDGELGFGNPVDGELDFPMFDVSLDEEQETDKLSGRPSRFDPEVPGDFRVSIPQAEIEEQNRKKEENKRQEIEAIRKQKQDAEDRKLEKEAENEMRRMLREETTSNNLRPPIGKVSAKFVKSTTSGGTNGKNDVVVGNNKPKLPPSYNPESKTNILCEQMCKELRAQLNCENEGDRDIDLDDLDQITSSMFDIELDGGTESSALNALPADMFYTVHSVLHHNDCTIGRLGKNGWLPTGWIYFKDRNDPRAIWYFNVKENRATRKRDEVL